MVTRIHKNAKPHLYLREHRRARGVSATAMGERLDMERESVLRLERESQRLKFEDQVAYADALGLESHLDLTRPPGTPSLDGLLAGADQDTRELAHDLVLRLVKKSG